MKVKVCIVAGALTIIVRTRPFGLDQADLVVAG